MWEGQEWENGSFNHAQTVLNWDPSSLEIKTRSVEKTLEPLVVQVSKILKQISQPSQPKINTSDSAEMYTLSYKQ